MSLRADLEAMERKQISCTWQESKQSSYDVHSVDYNTICSILISLRNTQFYNRNFAFKSVNPDKDEKNDLLLASRYFQP